MAINYTGLGNRSEAITICEKENSENYIILPVSPSEIMFKAQGDMKTITLLNFGEVPVGSTPKLVEWSVSSFFPSQDSKYWFDIYGGEYHPYQHYCKRFYDWYKAQTILTFKKETWDGYYNCTIKNFEFGQKDGTNNVHYTLDFVEYKTTNTNTDSTDYSYGKTNYSGQYYYPDEGETVLTIAKKIYGNTEYYRTLLRLNNWSSPVRIISKGEKVIIK